MFGLCNSKHKLQNIFLKFYITKNCRMCTCTFTCFVNLDVPDYPVRLVSSTGNESTGGVQLYHEDTWGSVCDPAHFSSHDARVVCTSLGFSLGAQCNGNNCSRLLSPIVSSLSPVWTGDMDCDDSSVAVSSCHTVFGTHLCNYHTHDVAITCICKL